MDSDGPKFTTVVRIILSLLAIPVTVWIIDALVYNQSQTNAATQLSDNVQDVTFQTWLATHQNALEFLVVLLVWACIWSTSILKYYFDH